MQRAPLRSCAVAHDKNRPIVRFRQRSGGREKGHGDHARGLARRVRVACQGDGGRATRVRTASEPPRCAHPFRAEIERRAQHVSHGGVRRRLPERRLREHVQLGVQRVVRLALDDLVELGEMAWSVGSSKDPPPIVLLAASLLRATNAAVGRASALLQHALHALLAAAEHALTCP
eukprot:7323302-Prymnesium_polylepis.1